MKSDENQPVSLAEARKLINFGGDPQGRALLRELQTREQAKRVQILSRRQGNRTHWRVTLASIRKHAPDLMPAEPKTPVEMLLRETRRYLEAIDVRIEERVAEHVAKRVEPELEKLREEDIKLATTLRDLAATVERYVVSN